MARRADSYGRAPIPGLNIFTHWPLAHLQKPPSPTRVCAVLPDFGLRRLHAQLCLINRPRSNRLAGSRVGTHHSAIRAGSGVGETGQQARPAVDSWALPALGLSAVIRLRTMLSALFFLASSSQNPKLSQHNSSAQQKQVHLCIARQQSKQANERIRAANRTN